MTRIPLQEWGREFPVSGNIPQLLDSIVHRWKPIRDGIWTLYYLSVLFEDSSLLIVPVRFLQSVQCC
jgi:hypothetical protein